MSKVAGDSYLGAIKDSLDSPNMVLDLRIPQNQKYQQVVLDEAIARYLAGETRRGRDGQGRARRLERSQRADRRREPAQVLQGLARRPALTAIDSFPARRDAPGTLYPLEPHRERERAPRAGNS